MRKPLFVIVLLIQAAVIFAADIPRKLSAAEDPYRLLERARVAFDRGSYGDAISLADQARHNRKRDNEWKLYTLRYAIQAPAVQAAGSALDRIMSVLRERDDMEAYGILESLIDVRGAAYFSNSIDEVLAYLERTAAFPEVDFLIGRIYRIEGEYDLAKRYLTRAWENAASLDIPELKYDILYALADLARIQGDDDEYERALLLVLADDPDYNGLLTGTIMNQTETGLFIKSLVSSLQRNFSVDKFFLMYRAHAYRSLDACVGLSEQYLRLGQLDKALTLSAFGSVLAISRLYEVVSQRDKEFEYTDLASLLSEGLKYPDIYNWTLERSVWKQLYLFASAASQNGLKDFSLQLYADIENVSPDSYWQELATLASRQ